VNELRSRCLGDTSVKRLKQRAHPRADVCSEQQLRFKSAIPSRHLFCIYLIHNHRLATRHSELDMSAHSRSSKKALTLCLFQSLAGVIFGWSNSEGSGLVRCHPVSGFEGPNQLDR
jgi:hypothetical protein